MAMVRPRPQIGSIPDPEACLIVNQTQRVMGSSTPRCALNDRLRGPWDQPADFIRLIS